MEYPIQHPLYRCWYPRSAGKLRSGKLNHGSQPVSLTTGDVNAEIQRLRNHQNPVPTALVPTNSEFLLILHVAIRLTYRGIAPNDIVIAFIAPWKSPATIHNGQALIKAAGDPGKIAYRFKHAYYYEWEIPAAHLRHTVTLGTVIRRGFSLAWRSPGMNFPSYLDLLEFLWEWHPDPDPYGKGYRCGLDACEFGLRAPVRQIAGALSGYECFYQCGAPKVVAEKASRRHGRCYPGDKEGVLGGFESTEAGQSRGKAKA